MNAETVERTRDEIRRALRLLHTRGLVFGDLRPPNVMITEAKEVQLIDFDWAGECGQIKYPFLISPSVDWPAGVKALDGLFTIALVKLPDSLQNSLCATFSPFLARNVRAGHSQPLAVH